MDINIEKKTILVLILFIPFIQPVFFNRIELIDNIYSILSILTLIIFIMIFFKNINLKKYTLVFIAYQLLYLISSSINKIPIDSIFITIAKNISACVLIEYLTRKDTKYLLKGLTWLLNILVIINLFLIFLYPEGVTYSITGEGINFLEADNKLAPILILTMTCSSLDSLYRKNKISINSWIIIALCVITITIVWSATGVMAIGAFLINLSFIYNKVISKKINMNYYNVFFIGIFLFLVIFRLQDYFKDFIVNFLNKDVTLSNRIYIWDSVIDIISNASSTQLILGHGYDIRLIPINMRGVMVQTHSHNEILKIVLDSGILGLSIFAYMIYVTTKKLSKYNAKKMSIVLMGSILAFFIMGLTEACYYIHFYIILALANNIDNMIYTKSE